MSVSNYKNNNCGYNIDKLEKVVYLIEEDDLRDIHIDSGEAYVTSSAQDPMALSVYNINLSDTDELDERYKFTHTLTFSMNGYARYTDFEGRYYAIVKTVDGEYWLVNPMFPCKVTYTYTLDAEGSHTDFTLATISNHPTLRIQGIDYATPSECGYHRCTFGRLRLNESMNSLLSGNHVIYTNDGFKDVDYNKDSAVFTETFDGKSIQHRVQFNIKFDGYKSSWHYNLLEFTENKYAAIIETSCGGYILVGFHFGLQPAFTVTATNEETNRISINLFDSHDNGTFISYLDNISVEKDGTTNWKFTSKYNGYECVGHNTARYLLKEEFDALMNPTYRYMALDGYESQFSFLNIVGTFLETETFVSYDCTCRMQSSFPFEIVFNDVSCKEYGLLSNSPWSISSSEPHITVTPTSGMPDQLYTVQICNTLPPSDSNVRSTLSLTYCNNKTDTYNVVVKNGNDCLPAGTVFDINSKGQYLVIPTSCCVRNVVDLGGTITNITIQNTYIKVYIPQDNNGTTQYTLKITFCDGTECEVTINYVHFKAMLIGDTTEVIDCNESTTLSSSEVGSTSATSIILGDCVTEIGTSAFTSSSSLSSVTIPSNVTSIGANAFRHCSGLTSIEIPNSVTSIGNQAFYKCSGLTSCSIGSGITSIAYGTFNYCTSLSSVTIPNSVTSIGNLTFSECTGLSSVTLSDSLTSIGQGAFMDCTSLENIIIPNSVTNIDVSAFNGCSGLTSITVNATTPPTIGSNAFANTNNCPIYVPCGSVNAYKSASGWSTYADRIGCSEFKLKLIGDTTSVVNCNESTTLTQSEVGRNVTATTAIIGDCVTIIGEWAFMDCTSLESVIISDSVTTIGDDVFHYSRVSSCTIGSGVTTIGQQAFYTCNLTSITIPNSVTSIGYGAFGQCPLTSVTIGSGVTSIGGDAFGRCTRLTSVTIQTTTPPTVGSNVFEDTNDCPIYVPAASVNAYKTASGWSTYASRIQAIP